MWEGKAENVKCLQYIHTFCLIEQCVIESDEDDNDIMTSRNEVNANAVGRSSF